MLANFAFNENEHRYKYLVHFSMLFITVTFFITLTIDKFITDGMLLISVSTFFVPFWFFLADILTEVYGATTSRKVILIVTLMQFLFAALFFLLATLHNTTLSAINVSSNDQLLDSIPKMSLSIIFATLIGGFINTFIIAKATAWLSNIYHWVAMVIISTIGQAIFIIFSNILGFIFIYHFDIIFKLSYSEIMCVFVLNLLFFIPFKILINYIKVVENIQGLNSRNETTGSKFNKTTKITNLYTGTDGKTYFKEIELNIPMKRELGYYSKNYECSSFKIREFKPGSKIDWHVSPSVRCVIYLSGEIEITSSSGEKRIFKDGDMLLITDTTGNGHTTRTLKEGRSVIIHI